MFWVSVEEKTHATPFANTYEYKKNVSDKTTDIAFFWVILLTYVPMK